MQYLGGKVRLAKHILAKMYDPDRIFVDAFCGGGAVVERSSAKRRYAFDVNPYLIEMFRAVQKGWLPPEHVSEDLYHEVRASVKARTVARSDMPLAAAIGFGSCFAGKWFAGYARPSKSVRNYAATCRRALAKAAPKIRDVTFSVSPFLTITNPEFVERAVIYCDPPYGGTTGYSTLGYDAPVFDKRQFVQHCRTLASMGAKVYVSEYEMPEDFRVIWEKPHKSTVNIGKGQATVEKLFTL